MPTETLIRQHQADYYDALQASRVPDIDAAPFVEYLLGIVAGSLAAYEHRAASGVGVGVGVDVGVSEAVITLLRANPTLSAVAIAKQLGKAPRTIERHLRDLRAAGRLRREGPPKTGRWIVVE